MGAAKHIKETFQKEAAGKKENGVNYKAALRERIQVYRKDKSSVVRVDKPTNLPRARTLGYKAKKGFVIARVRVRKGSGTHPRPKAGRRPKAMGTLKKTRKKSIIRIAEERASRKFKNCEVLNSYPLGDDGKIHYFEIILIDVLAPEILADKERNRLSARHHKGRAERGKTSAGQKGRGMRGKGKGHEKARKSKKNTKGRIK